MIPARPHVEIRHIGTEKATGLPYFVVNLVEHGSDPLQVWDGRDYYAAAAAAGEWERDGFRVVDLLEPPGAALAAG